VAAGGKAASGWAAFGISLLCLAVVLVPIFVIAFVAAVAAKD
jgi:heme exporter protein D